MKFWKQLVVSAIIILGATAVWLKLDPGAANLFARIGIPVPAILASDGNAATSDQAKPSSPRQPGGGRGRAALVIAAPVTSGIVNDRFSAIGSGAPARTVAVQPQVSGQVSEVLVTSGSDVSVGDILVRLDSSEQEIALDQARLAVETARNKVSRFENLLKQRTISSVEADAARTELESAELALRQAELAFERRVIRAPISGTIGILSINAGDFVTNQTVIANIDDRAHILVEFFVPERLVGELSIGHPVEAHAIARPGDNHEGRIIALDNRLDEASRTLRVQADIPNPEGRLRAGMSFQVRMKFEGETFPSVDPLTIQWDSQGSYVWRIADGVAERVGISIIQRNAENVLVEAELKTGDLIVTEGVQNVRDGGQVKLVDRNGDDVKVSTEQADG